MEKRCWLTSVIPVVSLVVVFEVVVTKVKGEICRMLWLWNKVCISAHDAEHCSNNRINNYKKKSPGVVERHDNVTLMKEEEEQSIIDGELMVGGRGRGCGRWTCDGHR